VRVPELTRVVDIQVNQRVMLPVSRALFITIAPDISPKTPAKPSGDHTPPWRLCFEEELCTVHQTQNHGLGLSAKFVRGLGSSSTVRRMRRLQPRSGVGIVARRAEPLASSAIFPLQANMISSRSEQLAARCWPSFCSCLSFRRT